LLSGSGGITPMLNERAKGIDSVGRTGSICSVAYKHTEERRGEKRREEKGERKIGGRRRMMHLIGPA